MLDKIVNFFLVHAAIVIPLAVLLAVVVSSTARKGVQALLRLVARLLFIAAVVALVADGTRTLAGGSGFVMTQAADHLALLWPAGPETLKKLVTARLHPAAWDYGMAYVMRTPTWVVLGVLGLMLALLGRRRKEVPIYIN